VLELIKFVLSKLDFLEISEFLRTRNNRRVVASLFRVLIATYDFIDLYREILDELRDILDARNHEHGKLQFSFNPARMTYLLSRQSANLENLETLYTSAVAEIRIVDNEFAKSLLRLTGGKGGLLLDAQMLLMSGRLSLADTGPDQFPVGTDKVYRTLWFSDNKPSEDDRDIAPNVPGSELQRVDVNFYDGEEFFKELDHYFRDKDPLRQLNEIEEMTERYKQALLVNFNLENALSDIGSVARYKPRRP
jgi:hypothetical protein